MLTKHCVRAHCLQFGTRFAFAEVQGRQTTQGIWVSRAELGSGDREVIVLDLEGSGGVEALQANRDNFENKTALFGLAVADVLIVNVKTEAREQAAVHQLLERIMEVRH